MMFSDEEFLLVDARMLEDKAGREFDGGELDRITVAADLAERIRERRHFVRAFAFSQNMPLDSYRFEEGQRLGIERMMREADPGSASDLNDAIVREAEAILEALGGQSVAESFAGTDMKPFVRLDAPTSAGEAGEIAQAYLLLPGDRYIRFKDDSAESRG